MQPASFEAATRVLPDGAVIELRGDIDAAAKVALTEAYDASAKTGGLLLDFEHVAYVNSAGIALIIGLLTRARADKRAVAARGLSDHYREIFEITRLSDFVTVLADDASQRTDEHEPER